MERRRSTRLPISDENIASILIELIKLKRFFGLCDSATVKRNSFMENKGLILHCIVELYSPKGPPNIHAHRVQPEECSQKEKEHTNGWKREKGI